MEPWPISLVQRLPALLCVGLGGAVGSIVRYALAAWVERHAAALGWWGGGGWGTLVVNVVGCAAAGVVGGVLVALGRGQLVADAAAIESVRLLVVVGFLGGFTTFSAFGWQLVSWVEQRQWALAASYAMGTLVLSVLACGAGACVGAWLGQKISV